MKKLLVLSALMAAATVLLSSSATAQSYLNETGEPCPEGLVAAGDYCYTPEAYDLIQNDPFACEGIPTSEEFLACLEAQTGSSPAPAEDPTMTAVSCSGFASQFGAQQYYDFNATPEEQALLDPDGDGFACNELQSGTDELGANDAVESGPASEMYSALPDTGGPALLLPLGLLVAVASFVLARRVL